MEEKEQNKENKDEEEKKRLEEEELQKRKKEEEEHQKRLKEEENREKKNLEKYRINYHLLNSSQPITKITAICPICTGVPNISLSLNSEKGHYVKCFGCRYCYCCSHPRSKTLDDYISIMVKMHQDNLKCDIHKEKGQEEEAYFSCEICQKWMCEECINNHVKEYQSHNYYIIRKNIKEDNNSTCYKHNKEYKYYITDGFAFGYHACESCKIRYGSDDVLTTINREEGECCFNQLKQIIKEGVEYLDIYCKNIYENLSNSIKDDPSLTQKAKDIYDKFLIRNRRLLFYYQMLINTGTPSFMNATLIKNISKCLLTKFDKINIEFTGKLNKEQIEQILNFFETNYMFGTKEYELKELNDLIDIKEIAAFEKEKEIKKKTVQENKELKKEENDEKEKEKEEEEEKFVYIGIIIIEKNIIICGTENGDIHVFEIDNSSLNSKFIRTKKAHEKSLISLDNIKSTSNKFVTCDEKDIKIWQFIKKDNKEYVINCETTFKKISESDLTYLYVLNYSDSISFINEDNKVIILNTYYKPFFKVSFDLDLKGLYQIDSDDENSGLFIVCGEKLVLYNLIGKIDYKGFINCEPFSAKSFCYIGNNKLLVGGNSKISIVNVKDMKLEYIIEMSPAECTCFLKFKNIILCGYGDTSGCSFWSRGVAQEKTTKFLILKQNKDNIDKFYLENDFNEFGIIDAKFIAPDKFISCFYKDNRLKIFELK